MTLPAVSVRLTPNYTPGPRATTRGVFVHSTRGGAASLEEEYQGTVNYFCTPGVEASAHLVIGPTATTRCVENDDIAWHAMENNAYWLGVELAQPTSADAYSDYQYETLAAFCKVWAARYGFPLVRVMSQHDSGLIAHEDSEQGKREGKSDPGRMWNWQRFMEMLR